MSDTDEPKQGGIGSVDRKVANAIYQSILEQHKLTPFKHGSTAAYWKVIHTLNTHLKQDESI